MRNIAQWLLKKNLLNPSLISLQQIKYTSYVHIAIHILHWTYTNTTPRYYICTAIARITQINIIPYLVARPPLVPPDISNEFGIKACSWIWNLLISVFRPFGPVLFQRSRAHLHFRKYYKSRAFRKTIMSRFRSALGFRQEKPAFFICGISV